MADNGHSTLVEEYEIWHTPVQSPGQHSVADDADVSVDRDAGETAPYERVADGEHVGMHKFRDGASSVQFPPRPASAGACRGLAAFPVVVDGGVAQVGGAQAVHGDASRRRVPVLSCCVLPQPVRGFHGHFTRAVAPHCGVASGGAQRALVPPVLARQPYADVPVAVVVVYGAAHLAAVIPFHCICVLMCPNGEERHHGRPLQNGRQCRVFIGRTDEI